MDIIQTMNEATNMRRKFSVTFEIITEKLCNNGFVDSNSLLYFCYDLELVILGFYGQLEMFEFIT